MRLSSDILDFTICFQKLGICQKCHTVGTFGRFYNPEDPIAHSLAMRTAPLTPYLKYVTFSILMDNTSCLIYSGSKFTLEWYYDKNGKSVAFEFFLKASEELQKKFLVLIRRMGDLGIIFDKTKFRYEGDGIYAFKPQPDRYLSFFTNGKKIIVTNGFTKKTDKLPKNEKDIAIRCRQDYFERNKEE